MSAEDSLSSDDITQSHHDAAVANSDACAEPGKLSNRSNTGETSHFQTSHESLKHLPFALNSAMANNFFSNSAYAHQQSGLGFVPVSNNSANDQQCGLGFVPVSNNSVNGQQFGLGVLPVSNNSVNGQQSGLGILPVSNNSVNDQQSGLGFLPVSINSASGQQSGLGFVPVSNNSANGQQFGLGFVPVSTNSGIVQQSGLGFVPVSNNSTSGQQSGLKLFVPGSNHYASKQQPVFIDGFVPGQNSKFSSSCSESLPQSTKENLSQIENNSLQTNGFSNFPSGFNNLPSSFNMSEQPSNDSSKIQTLQMMFVPGHLKGNSSIDCRVPSNVPQMNESTPDEVKSPRPTHLNLFYSDYNKLNHPINGSQPSNPPPPHFLMRSQSLDTLPNGHLAQRVLTPNTPSTANGITSVNFSHSSVVAAAGSPNTFSSTSTQYGHSYPMILTPNSLSPSTPTLPVQPSTVIGNTSGLVPPPTAASLSANFNLKNIHFHQLPGSDFVSVNVGNTTKQMHVSRIPKFLDILRRYNKLPNTSSSTEVQTHSGSTSDKVHTDSNGINGTKVTGDDVIATNSCLSEQPSTSSFRFDTKEQSITNNIEQQQQNKGFLPRSNSAPTPPTFVLTEGGEASGLNKSNSTPVTQVKYKFLSTSPTQQEYLIKSNQQDCGYYEVRPTPASYRLAFDVDLRLSLPPPPPSPVSDSDNESIASYQSYSTAPYKSFEELSSESDQEDTEVLVGSSPGVTVNTVHEEDQLIEDFDEFEPMSENDGDGNGDIVDSDSDLDANFALGATLALELKEDNDPDFADESETSDSDADLIKTTDIVVALKKSRCRSRRRRMGDVIDDVGSDTGSGGAREIGLYTDDEEDVLQQETWICVECNQINNKSFFRYCEKCWKTRRNWLPAPPNKRKKRRKSRPRHRKKCPVEPSASQENDPKFQGSTAQVSKTSEGKISPCVSNALNHTKEIKKSDESSSVASSTLTHNNNNTTQNTPNEEEKKSLLKKNTGTVPKKTKHLENGIDVPPSCSKTDDVSSGTTRRRNLSSASTESVHSDVDMFMSELEDCLDGSPVYTTIEPNTAPNSDIKNLVSASVSKEEIKESTESKYNGFNLANGDSLSPSAFDSGLGSSQESYVDCDVYLSSTVTASSTHPTKKSSNLTGKKVNNGNSPAKKTRRAKASSSNSKVLNDDVFLLSDDQDVVRSPKGTKRKRKNESGYRANKRSNDRDAAIHEYLTESVMLVGNEEEANHEEEGAVATGENRDPIEIISANVAEYFNSGEGTKFLLSAQGRVLWNSKKFQSSLLNYLSRPTCSSEPKYDLSLCIMCQDRPKDAAIIHGQISHQATCYTCAKTLFNQKQRCPVCRRTITKITKHIIA